MLTLWVKYILCKILVSDFCWERILFDRQCFFRCVMFFSESYQKKDRNRISGFSSKLAADFSISQSHRILCWILKNS